VALTLDLGGRACLVVGGAGGGVGTATALAAAEAGAAVGVITNVEAHADEIRAQLGEGAAVVTADVTDEAAFVAAIATVAAQVGPLRHLVNVVGGNTIDDYHPAADFDMEAFDRVVSRNLRYAVVACREVARPMLEQGAPGSIVNVSSAASRGAPLLGAYAAAKSGLEAFSRTMAIEWAPSGLRVNVVSLGMVRTPRTGLEDPPDVAASIPLRRRGDASEAAQVAMFLLSDLASYVTGQTLVVDGGLTLGHPGGVGLSSLVTRDDVRSRFDRG
jgi:NAD(P)-dependent dehydrogenase (short-subunit alcohol dehydrogenase family)